MLVLQANAAIQAFSMGAGDENSDRHAYKTSTLSIEPSPQLLHRTLYLTNFIHTHCLTVSLTDPDGQSWEVLKASLLSLTYMTVTYPMLSMCYKYVIFHCDITLKSYRTKETKQSLSLRGKENWYYWPLTIIQEMCELLYTRHVTESFRQIPHSLCR